MGPDHDKDKVTAARDDQATKPASSPLQDFTFIFRGNLDRAAVNEHAQSFGEGDAVGSAPKPPRGSPGIEGGAEVIPSRN